MKNILLNASAVVLLLFALVTLLMSSSVIFDLFGIREKEGNYVLFVVVANFSCGIIYLISAYGFLKRARWTFRALLLSVVILILTFSGLGLWIYYDGLYEAQTIKAMIFRILLSIAFTGISWHYLSRHNE